MMLFGCAYYPWARSRCSVRVRYVFLLNPLVFMSEAMRLAVTPDVPHMPVALLLAGLASSAPRSACSARARSAAGRSSRIPAWP